MPTQKPHSSSYSLKDLILVGSVVKFTLGVTAAILMRQRNGTAHNAVNNTLWAIAVVVVIQGFLGSVASWVDNRKQEERLHEMLEQGDALSVTNSSGDTSSAQLSSTGPVGVLAAGNGQDEQRYVDKSVIAPNLPETTTTNTNSLSPTLTPSTCNSTSLPALGGLFPFSQIENSGRNEESIRNTETNGVKSETQQPTPALTQGNITRHAAPSTTGSRASTFPPVPGVSVLADAKRRNEESITMNPAATDKSNGIMDTQGNRAGSIEETGLLSSGAGPNAVAVHGHSQYNEETGDGERGTITHDNLLTGVVSSIHVASSTLLGAPDSLLPFQAEDLRMNQGTHPTTGSDGAGMQEHREPTLGGDYVAVGQHKEQLVVIHDSPLTMSNMDDTPPTASRRFLLMPDEVAEGKEKQEHTEVDPNIGSPEVPQTWKNSSKVD